MTYFQKEFKLHVLMDDIFLMTTALGQRGSAEGSF